MLVNGWNESAYHSQFGHTPACSFTESVDAAFRAEYRRKSIINDLFASIGAKRKGGFGDHSRYHLRNEHATVICIKADEDEVIGEDWIIVLRVYCRREKRKLGYASSLLRKIVDAAEEYQCVLRLCAEKHEFKDEYLAACEKDLIENCEVRNDFQESVADKEASARLVKWYQSFGFELAGKTHEDVEHNRMLLFPSKYSKKKRAEWIVSKNT